MGSSPCGRVPREMAPRLQWFQETCPAWRAPYRVSGDADRAFSSLVTLGSSFALGEASP